MKKVPEQEWQDLQDKLEALKEEHEDIIHSHTRLLKKYDAIKAKRGAMSRQQRDGLEAQVKELRSQIALKEKQLHDEKDRAVEGVYKIMRLTKGRDAAEAKVQALTKRLEEE